jgi:DNA polymerase-3 subunit delta
MFYTFVSSHRFYLQQALEAFLTTKNTHYGQCLHLDAKSIPIQDILLEASTVSLDDSRKTIIIHQPYFLMKEGKEKIEALQDFTTLEKAFEHPDPHVDIIFLVIGSLDERKNLVKTLKTFFFKNLEPAKSYQWPSLLNPTLVRLGFNLDSRRLQSIIDATYPDIDRCFVELEKLANYDLNPSIEAIKLLIKPALEDNVFELSNALLQENIKKALMIFQDLKNVKEEPIYLINLLGKQFQLFSKIQYLARQNLDTFQISKALKVHEYRVKVLLDQQKKFPIARLESIIVALANLDVSIKKGQIDRYFGLEYFITNFKSSTF